MGDELMVRRPMDEVVQHAKLLAEASLLPDSYRKQPANIMVAMELAEALEIPLIQAINGVSVIKGKPTMSAELMRALVLRAGHRFKVDVATDEGCRVLVARREWPDDVSEFTFTMKDAQRAGLASGEQYKKHPKSMLLARATSQACRAVFPDVIAGVSYTPDELGDPVGQPRLRVPARGVEQPPEAPRVGVEAAAVAVDAQPNPEVRHDADGVVVDGELLDPGEE